MTESKTTRNGRSWRVPWTDASLSALLITQCLITFVAIPLSVAYPTGHLLMDLGHLVFAAVCAFALTDRRVIRLILLAAILCFAYGPSIVDALSTRLDFGPALPHEVIAAVAFCFNALVSVLVARRAFGPGHVTAHRVQGAVLVYLNVAALFAIAYGMLEAHSPGSIRPTAGGLLPGAGTKTANLSYFSLATITTTGYGDIVPVHQLARSLANLEAVFGQLFPATFVARLVALHLAHARQAKPEE